MHTYIHKLLSCSSFDNIYVLIRTIKVDYLKYITYIVVDHIFFCFCRDWSELLTSATEAVIKNMIEVEGDRMMNKRMYSGHQKNAMRFSR